MKKYTIKTGDLNVTVKANNWKEAIIKAFADTSPTHLGILTEIKTAHNEVEYINTIVALKMVGYSIKD
jgi:hypothetical protein